MKQDAARVLVCSYHVVEPDRDSGSRRTWHFLDFLQAAGWQVTFLASDGVGDARAVRTLQQRGIVVWDGLKDRVDELLSSHQFDLAILAFWSNAERYMQTLRESSPEIRVIVDSVDLHFLRETRQVFHPRSGEQVPRLLDAKHGSRFVRELNAYAAADGVLTVSAKEAELIADLTGDAGLAHAVPDCEAFAPSALPLARRRGILSLGSFQHPPNVQAVEYLCTEILPRIEPSLLAKHPVYVVGNALTGAIREYGRVLPGVRMVGWVPTVAPYFEQTRISVVPLLYGAGTKRKMIQALMTETPTVSTSIGVEGLGLRHGEHVMIADDPASFAASITALLTDDRLWQTIARGGRTLIAHAHSTATAERLLLSAIADVMECEPKAPVRLGDPGDAPAQMGKEHYHRELVPRIRKIVADTLPKDAAIIVASKGDPALLKLNGARASHYPQTSGGDYAGHHPADSVDAIQRLEALRGRNGEFLLLPSTAFWWLEHYPGLRQHLENRYRQVLHQEDTCIIYDLRERASQASDPSSLRPADAGLRSSIGALSEPAPSPDIKLIAFYLPQFHPIPENDAWWGDGFTEWRNVAKADPQFPGHYQPHVPADLGFYDLRLAETRDAQAGLARRYGIHGFCYYHYWFNGRRLLERPFNEVLASGSPDLPFCLCWANDPWSRRWDGREDELLQAQTYSAEDDLAHIRSLLPALADPRAIRIDGKPIFLVYRGRHLPEPSRTVETWRTEVHRAGLSGIYLIAMETAWDLGWDATTVGFDATVLFQPQFGTLMTSGRRIRIPGKENLQVYDYRDAWRLLSRPEPVAHRRFECVFPGWDNSPRVGDKAVVMHRNSPAAYEEVLRAAIQRARGRAPGERVVFVNAWNEWAEGCHLEPDQRHGHAFLEATERALRVVSPVRVTVSA